MRRPLLFACVCVSAVIYLYMCVFNPPPWDVEYIPGAGEYTVVTGQVYKKENQNIYYLQNISFEGISYAQPSQSNIRCELQQYTDLSLGTLVRVEGFLGSYTCATNPGEFDASVYYGIQDICGRIREGRVTHAGEKYWPVRQWLQEGKEIFTARLVKAFGAEDGGILVKMLLGDGTFLEGEIKALYQENGIVHILSISGLHISMLGMGVYYLLRKCGSGLYVGAVTGGAFILLYGTMTGFGLSATRAIGMYLLHMLAIIWGKSYDMLTAMGVLLLTMILENPRVLFHSGFLLSFGSVCGLGLLLPRLQEYISRGAPLLVSLSVTVFTLPMQFSYFYKIPLYSAFLNLLVLPFLSIVMVVGLVVMLVPALHHLHVIGALVLRWYELLCHMFERLPFHILYVGCPPVWKIVVFYAGLGFFICYKPRKKRKWPLLIPAALTAFLCIQTIPPLRMVMLDVGQGDGILLQTRAGTVLVDGGSSSKGDVGKYQMAPCFAYYGVDYLDAVVITHPDTDHMNGLAGLLENGYGGRIGRILLPDIRKEWREKEFAGIYALASEYGIPISYMGAGDELRLGEVRLLCLHPHHGASMEESNAYSQVYYLTYRDFSALLTGDVEGEGEGQLLKALRQQNMEDLTLLKVAHHGSRFSTGEELLSQLSPQLALISCGENNSYGHPHAETIERLQKCGCEILTTPEQGAIIIEVGKEMKVYGYRK